MIVNGWKEMKEEDIKEIIFSWDSGGAYSRVKIKKIDFSNINWSTLVALQLSEVQGSLNFWRRDYFF